MLDNPLADGWLPGYYLIKKSAVLLEYAKEHGCKTMVETGTAYGEMLAMTKESFEVIHSVELKDSLYQRALVNFAGYPYIHFHLGDSTEVLPGIIKLLPAGAAIYWLDAHYSGGLTARGAKDTPIIEELTAILYSGRENDVILIDDSPMFGTDPAYPTVDEVKEIVLRRNQDAKIELDPEGIIIITQRKP